MTLRLPRSQGIKYPRPQPKNLRRRTCDGTATPPKGGTPDFPVQTKDGRIVSSVAISETLTRLPAASFDYVFVAPQFHKKALDWLAGNRKNIIKPEETPNSHGPVK